MTRRITCSIERRGAGRVLEFASCRWPAPGIAAPQWPITPGGVRSGAAGQPELLHFAPGRWLAPDPLPGLSAAMQSAAAAGEGTLIDVTGKWERVDISGPGAARLLASTLAIDAVLEGRDCAALTLFDCPALITRIGESFALWVQSSYATDFLATAERLRELLQCER